MHLVSLFLRVLSHTCFSSGEKFSVRHGTWLSLLLFHRLLGLQLVCIGKFQWSSNSCGAELGGTFITICHGMRLFLPLKGNVLMSLFSKHFFDLWKISFCGTPHPSLPLNKDDKKEAQENSPLVLCWSEWWLQIQMLCSNLRQKLSWEYYVQKFLVLFCLALCKQPA